MLYKFDWMGIEFLVIIYLLLIIIYYMLYYLVQVIKNIFTFFTICYNINFCWIKYINFEFSSVFALKSPLIRYSYLLSISDCRILPMFLWQIPYKRYFADKHSSFSKGSRLWANPILLIWCCWRLSLLNVVRN